MTNTNGLTQKDLKQFSDLLTKANTEQLRRLKSSLDIEMARRNRGNSQ